MCSLKTRLQMDRKREKETFRRIFEGGSVYEGESSPSSKNSKVPKPQPNVQDQIRHLEQMARCYEEQV